MKRPGSRGFTLIEVLVVLALTGLISVVLMQMTAIMFRGYDQATRVQSQLAVDAMRYDWLRQSVSGMVASLDESFAFVGNRNEVTGFTMSSLFQEQGKVSRVRWFIRESPEGAVLWYEEADGEPVAIISWPDASRLFFQYRGQQSAWLDEWPSGDLPAGVLPFRVKLSVEDAQGVQDIFAAVDIRRTGRVDYRDYIN